MYVYVVTYIEGGWDNVDAVYVNFADAARYVLGDDAKGLSDQECKDAYTNLEEDGNCEYIIHDKKLKESFE